MNSKVSSVLLSVAAAFMAMTMAACSVSTANIGSLTTSKEKAGAASSVFAAGEAVHALATANNIPSKVVMKWRLYTVKVEGMTDNTAIPEADMSVDLAADGSTNYLLTPPASGFPPGTYKIEVTMIDGDGKQQDQKAATITINGK